MRVNCSHRPWASWSISISPSKRLRSMLVWVPRNQPRHGPGGCGWTTLAYNLDTVAGMTTSASTTQPPSCTPLRRVGANALRPRCGPSRALVSERVSPGDVAKLVDPQDRLAHDVAAAQRLQCSAKVAPADLEANLRSQLALRYQAGQEGEVPPEGPDVGRVDEEALDPCARAAPKVDEPEPRRLPGRGAIKSDRPAWLQRVDRPLQRATADALHNEVERAAGVLVSGDYPRRSQALQPLASSGTPDGRRNPSAADCSELHSKPADTAACARDQYIAAQQITPEAQRSQSCEPRHPKGGAGTEPHPVWQWRHAAGQCRNTLGPPCLVDERDGPRPLVWTTPVGRRLNHNSGDVLARPPARPCFQQMELAAVQRSKADLEHQFAGRRRWFVDVLYLGR